MGYSSMHKMLVYQKVLPPNNRPVHEVSKESGISVQTIYKWMQGISLAISTLYWILSILFFNIIT